MPKHIYDGTDYKMNPKNATPIGTGPYKFDKWEKGSFIHLVRNEDYHEDGLPYLDELYYHVIPDGAARAIAYETGKVDVARANAHVTFPARVQLIAAMNPCRCGHLGDASLACLLLVSPVEPFGSIMTPASFEACS